MTTHAAVWLEFDAPSDPVGPHERVCPKCFLIGNAAHLDCPNCDNAWCAYQLRDVNFPGSNRDGQDLTCESCFGPGGA